jgi:hypothetical protein
MPDMRPREDQGPSVQTAEGADRLGLDTGGLKLRLFAGMEVRAEPTEWPARCIDLQNVYEVSSLPPISVFAGTGKERLNLTSVAT